MKMIAVGFIGLEKGDVLLVTDVQNCFLPGGSLGVSRGNEVIEPLNRAIKMFRKKNLPVLFTRDWHPPDHCSFTEQGGPWPVHCVRDTVGAQLSSRLEIPDGSVILSKAFERDTDAYSSFHGIDESGQLLDELLKRLSIKRVFQGGLATDYCILNTVRDGISLGYEFYVLTDCIRAVDVHPGDGEKL
jgi:nicotinamidase/pyrazinamidase